MLPIQVLNTKGAAKRLGCSETWIHKLAPTGKLKASIYSDEGELIEHEKETRKQVCALSFLAENVEQYRPAPPARQQKQVPPAPDPFICMYKKPARGWGLEQT